MSKMVNILNIPELGKLEIVEVYEYYDQPVLYACKNAAGHFYLVVAAAENDQYLTWLCTAVSTERLNLIRSGGIDLHDAFADSENPYTIQVRVPYEEHASVQTDSIQSNQIPENMLPMRGECLDLETDTLPELSNPEEIARARKQEIMNLILNFDGILRTEAPAASVGKILGKLQDVINAIGMTCVNLDRITEDLKRKMNISVLGVGPGSFDIRLASPEVTQLKLFDDYDCGNAIEKFFELLNAKSKQDELKKLLGQLKPRVAKDYTEFFKTLNESVINTEFKWVSPNVHRGGTIRLSSSQMQKVIEVLEKSHEEIPPPFPITGKLTGAFLSTKRFEIETTDETYIGDIANEAIETVRNATLSRIYTAEIQENIEKSETTDETKTKYLLLSLK